MFLEIDLGETHPKLVFAFFLLLAMHDYANVLLRLYDFSRNDYPDVGPSGGSFGNRSIAVDARLWGYLYGFESGII